MYMEVHRLAAIKSKNIHNPKSSLFNMHTNILTFSHNFVHLYITSSFPTNTIKNTCLLPFIMN